MIKTPSDKWKKSILKYKKQCQSIIQISKIFGMWVLSIIMVEP